MHPHHPRRLDQPLQIIRHPIPRIQRPILPRLIRNPQQGHHPLLIHPHTLPRQPRQTHIRLVAALIHDIDIEVIPLVREQRGRVIPECRRGELQDREGGFVEEGGGGVPGLDLLAEDEAELGRVFVGDVGGEGWVEGLEDFGGEGAGVVEVCSGSSHC